MRLMISLAFGLFTLSLFITSGYGDRYGPPSYGGCPSGKKCCKHGSKWYWSTGGSSYRCISRFGEVESKHCDYGKVFDVNKCYCVRPATGCKWSSYGNWRYIDDECSKPCGGGYRRKRGTRTKEVSYNPHDKCEGDSHKTISVPCNTDPCGCKWSHWDDWEYIDDHCSKTCGGGSRRKRRTRTKEHSDNPHDKCEGYDHQTVSVPCNLGPCVHMCEETSPYAPANGYRRDGSDTAPYYPGEIIKFKCDRCYELVGNDYIKCFYNGHWDGPVPTCRKIKCSSVEAPHNGYMKYADRYCGGKTKFACDDGYKLVGYAEIICLDTGEYNYDHPPKCVPECPPGKCCKHGKWYWRTEGRGYKCKVLANGDIESKHCPYCQVFDVHKCDCVDAGIKCPQVHAPGCGVIVYADRNCGGKTKFACKPGCKLYGDPVITCKENGKYDSDPPKCIPDCRPEWGSWKKVYCGDCKRTGYGHNKQCSSKCTYERHCRPCGDRGYPGKRSTDNVELVRRGGGGGPSCHGDSKKYTTEPCGYCY